ncbi:peptidylprolyl isomerase [Streptomyces albipurpureus]|uniref:Peptidylprolyl isomerase n=1 Tax=Streptomyces albipurpureus TaxID=2897419 RepID=A0ABT0UZT9_9ACTN|nr:peptidylprolyl isomerase [Streptomyces sp. CWNU-1]MCM2392828.1 peptidylprolyl isomerase [Streptomyces sp. CWNU-1]
MVSSDQRRRQLAKEKFERQQQRRAQARRRRQRITIMAAAGAVVVASGVAVYASIGLSDGDNEADGQSPGAKASQPAAPTPSEVKSPEPALSVDKKAGYSMKLTSDRGVIEFAMEAAKTPRTVNSFKALAEKGYFNGTKCHRLTTEGIFVLQCGDPKGDGTGGPGYNIPDEDLAALGKPEADTKVAYPAGTVAMANTGQPNSGGSQFFLVYKDSRLPPTYTQFGKMDAASLKVLQDVAKAGVKGGGADGAPATSVTIKKAAVTKR